MPGTLRSVLTMPPSVWDDDPVQEAQRYAIYVEASQQIDADAERIHTLEEQLREAKSLIENNQSGDWTNEPPTAVGWYWFFGEPHQGELGKHYQDNFAKIDAHMHLVQVVVGPNGPLAVADGRVIPLTRFDTSIIRPGYAGYWKPATLPEPPLDVLRLFAASVAKI